MATILSTSRMTSLFWANLTIFLMLGLLLFRNRQLLSHIHHDDNEEADIISQTSPTLRNGEQRHLYLNEQENTGFFSQLLISLADSWRSSNKEPLCEFKGDEVLPKHVLLAKLVECYKIIRSKSAQSGGDRRPEGIKYIRNRRILRSSDDRESYTGSRTYTTASTVLRADATATTSRIAQDNNVEAAFHIDYSGPKTHPPKNN